MSYYDAKRAPSPDYGVNPAMSDPSGPAPAKPGEYVSSPPPPPTYSQHFAAPPPAVGVQHDSYTGGSQDHNREYYSPNQQHFPQQQFPQQPQQAYGGAPAQPQHHGSQGNVYQNVTPLYSLSSSSAPAQCPSCGARTMTRTQLKSGNTTHAWAAGLFLTTCLCCIPYCVSGTKDCEHRCGNCGILLAEWHRSGRTEVKAHA
ncbi:MAG: hypothetical protein M1828_004442 [Chrysothrix sp. TS-e1954]|nr:MAG: hypothetical protein M1828_004442 [Chrysothrix sp. TS-e1954]